MTNDQYFSLFCSTEMTRRFSTFATCSFTTPSLFHGLFECSDDAFRLAIRCWMTRCLKGYSFAGCMPSGRSRIIRLRIAVRCHSVNVLAVRTVETTDAIATQFFQKKLILSILPLAIYYVRRQEYRKMCPLKDPESDVPVRLALSNFVVYQ